MRRKPLSLPQIVILALLWITICYIILTDITVHAMEPMVKESEFVNDRELTPYINFADVSAGEKRRMVAMVRTSGNRGYYVDIFR